MRQFKKMRAKIHRVDFENQLIYFYCNNNLMQDNSMICKAPDEPTNTALHDKQPRRLIVAGGFLIKNDNVLLALRNTNSSDGDCYGLIGGKIDKNEAIHEGLIREIFEETGVKVLCENMKLIHVISLKKEDGTEIISFDFIITAWDGEPYNKEPHKHVHLEWFPLHQLPNTILERHKKAFELYQQGIYYSHYGW